MSERRRASDRADSGWHSQALWQAMSPHWPQLAVEVVEEIGSTNTALVERLREIARHTDRRDPRAGDLRAELLIAERQTRGRGRLGRAWQSGYGRSLTFSLAVPMRRDDWSGLSLAVGVAVADALDPTGQRVRLKWPNDLWLCRDGQAASGRKLGGILIEGLPVGTQRVAVIGVGLNVRPPLDLDPGVAVASVEEFQTQPTPPSVMAQVGPVLAEAVARFDLDGFGAFAERFARRDGLAGQAVVSTDPACPDGTADGVDPDGALRVRRGDRVQRLLSGEVSVRPAGQALPPVR